MADDGTLHIFPQIQSLVSDNLQVVSYKWLSRNFSVSSNHAKRLLQQFTEKFQNELKVIYVLSGWSVSDPKTYSVKLASSLKLAEVRKEFVDGCSVQVYSVQACIPDDLAVIWNTEFIQAEGFFNQPLTEENCLRDNRFCGVSNSFVKRSVEGKRASVAPPRHVDDGTGVAVPSKTGSTGKGKIVHPQQPLQGQELSSPGVDLSSQLKGEKNDKAAETVAKETTTVTNTLKGKIKNEKVSSGTSGSIASLWGRASAKPKAEPNTRPVLAAPVSAEAQICAQEAADAAGSEEDEHDISIKREPSGPSSRKRRVILDSSDDEDDDHGADEEDENVVSLASPDPSSGKVVTGPSANSMVSEGYNLDVNEDKGDGLKVFQDNVEPGNSAVSLEADIKSRNTKMTVGITLKERSPSLIQEDASKDNKDQKNQTSNGASTSPKRRKVLKTRIDDRGREVTEVVWEGEAVDADKIEKNDVQDDATKRAPLANKAQEAGSNAKTNPGSTGVNNKKPAKGGPKHAKQGSLLSFFKRA